MLTSALHEMKLRQRLLLVVGVVFIVAAAGAVVTARRYTDTLHARIDNERLNAATSLAGELDRLIVEGTAVLRVTATEPDRQFDANTLDRISAVSTVFTRGLLLVGSNGRVVAASDGARQLVGMDLSGWIASADQGSDQLLGWAFRPNDEGPVIALALPLPAGEFAVPAWARAGGYVVGLADQHESALGEALRRAKQIGHTGHADLVDSHAVSVASTEHDHVLKLADHPDFYLSMLARADRAPHVAQVAEAEEDGSSASDHVMGFAFLTVLPWGATLGGDATQTYAPISDLWYSLAGLAVVFGGLGVGITVVGSAQLVRPLQTLTASARRVADGELDTALETNAGGEIGALAESIDSMRRSLAAWGRELDIRVQERTEELQERTSELAVSEALARAAGRSLDLEALLTDMAAELERRLRVDGAILYVAGGGTRRNRIVGSPAVPRDLIEVERPCALCTTLTLSPSADESQWHALGRDRPCFRYEYRTALVLPLRTADRRVGTMCLLRRDDAVPVAPGAPFLNVLAAEVAMGVGNALLYDDLRWRETHRRELVGKVLTAQEEERRRLARELHDGTGQSLTALLLGLDSVSGLIGAEEGKGTEALQLQLAVLREMSASALTDLRKMVLALRPSDLDDLGLVPAITRYAQLMVGTAGIKVHVDSNLDDRRLTPEVEVAAFRIVQEALNNVVRHSGASRVEIRLVSRDGDFVVEVADDGTGFSRTRSDDPLAGVGLDGMRERASLIGGTLEIETRPGDGTLVRLSVQQGLDFGGASETG
jgi:signal transduction histidine kinase/HAMP domain-containing protein